MSPTNMPGFTFSDYKLIFSEAIAAGYKPVTMRDFFAGACHRDDKVLISRIDVDVKIERLPRLAEILIDLGIRSSIFLRMHAPTYNLLSFGNIGIIQDLVSAGHEIGLHTELIDAQGHCDIDAPALLRREVDLLETITGTKVHGTASHGDMTAFNNLDFWNCHDPAEFGLMYEAYDKRLWNACRYVSDSEWVRWKAYQDGVLIVDDRRTPAEHAKDGVPVLHVLTHPESWYDRYIYE